MFSMARGKNLNSEKVTLESTIRAIPRTMLAWIRPGRHLKIPPME